MGGLGTRLVTYVPSIHFLIVLIYAHSQLGLQHHPLYLYTHIPSQVFNITHCTYICTFLGLHHPLYLYTHIPWSSPPPIVLIYAHSQVHHHHPLYLCTHIPRSSPPPINLLAPQKMIKNLVVKRPGIFMFSALLCMGIQISIQFQASLSSHVPQHAIPMIYIIFMRS